MQSAPRARDRKGLDMANDSSFDIVSKLDHQEVDNALNQTAKEVHQRFDFKNTGAAIAWRTWTFIWSGERPDPGRVFVPTPGHSLTSTQWPGRFARRHQPGGLAGTVLERRAFQHPR